ncbi:MAG: 1,4-dihydroxy-2-naphthoate polyprenyltransferase, partial [Actinobacteria bacterium]|nr:1,4-dihydroxy-2-naphthoate polyprenyltransferase [Actinomycetota bacterium]
MKTKSKISIWFMAIRPKTLPAAAAPVIIGTAMAFSEEKINILVFSLTLLAALLIQVGTNLANDYFDFIKGTDNRERVGPIRVTQSGLLSKKEVKISFILIFALAVACGIFLTFRGGIPILFIGMLAIICGIFYTAGPFPLGYIGLADIFVLIFFGPVAVGGTFYLQTLNINSNVIIAGIAPGLLSVAIITANNLRDIETDRKSGKKTLVVRFGYKFGVLEYYFCIIFSLLIPVILVLLTRDNLLSLISLLAIFP